MHAQCYLFVSEYAPVYAAGQAQNGPYGGNDWQALENWWGSGVYRRGEGLQGGRTWWHTTHSMCAHEH